MARHVLRGTMRDVGMKMESGEMITSVTLTGPGGASVCVTSDRPFLWGKREQLLCGAYLPGVHSEREGPGHATINHYEQDVESAHAVKNHVTLAERWDGVVSQEVFHCAYALLRSQWLATGLAVVHGACVTGPTGSRLLVGHSGSGKTSLVLALLARGGRCFSGNTTLVRMGTGLIEPVAGTAVMTIPTTSDAMVYDGIEYGGRTAFPLSSEQTYSDPAPVTEISVMRWQPSAAERSVVTFPGSLHTLYPYFVDAVHADCILGGGMALVAGDEIDSRARVAAELGEVLTDCMVSTVRGWAIAVAELMDSQPA